MPGAGGLRASADETFVSKRDGPPGHEAFREHLRRAATREFFAAPVAVRRTEAGPIPAVVPVPADER